MEFARRSFSGALIFATVASAAAVVSGHSQAKGVYANQPAKLAAFEGHYRTGPGDLSLFGIPNDKTGRLHYRIAIPGALGFLLDGDFDKEVIGLDTFRPEDRPPPFLPFASYHVMAALGFFFVGVTLLASVWRFREQLFEKRWLMWVFVFAVVGPVVANQGGWAAAEVGRQPWLVHPPLPRAADGAVELPATGVFAYDESQGLRTERGVSKVISAGQVLGSIIGFGLVYLALLAVWLLVLFGLALFPSMVTARNDPALSVTIFNAASSAKTLGIMLIIAAIGMPLVLTDTAIVYRAFRGKVRLGRHSY